MKKSIVIRGSLSYSNHPQNFIEEIIESIRSWFDGEIVISTWFGQEKFINESLKIDKLILDNDPGPGPIQHWKRQVVSSKNGLDNSTGDFILISRPDIIFQKNIFEYIEKYPKSNSTFKIFDHKLIVPNMMTIRPDVDINPKYFRVSDWFHLGYRSDLEKYINVLEHIESFDHSKHDEKSVGICTEVSWFLSALKNELKEKINIHNCDNIVKYAWEAILNNFIVLNTRSTLGAYNLNWNFQPEDLDCYLTEEIYDKKYNEMFK